MKIVIVSGSHQSTGQSLKVAQYCAARLEKLGVTASVVDLSEGKLPLWDNTVWKKDPKWNSTWGPISDQLAAADGVIVISPEYAGMASAAIKNFFLFATAPLLAHKPALLVGVSAGMGGSYPIAELRASSYKNCHVNFIPDHVIVRHANDVLNDSGDFKYATAPGEGITGDDLTRTRMQYSLELLIEYAKALRAVRDSGKVNTKEFANGM